MVAERFLFTAVHTGEFRGMRPNGAPVRYRGMAFFRIADGKIVARWGVEDHLEMMRQIGVPVGPGGKG